MQGAVPQWTIGDAVGEGWRRFWPNILPLAIYGLVAWLIQALVQQLAPQTESTAAAVLFSVVSLVVGQLIAIGWIALALDVVDGRPVGVESITNRLGVLVPYVLAALLFSIMLTVGLALLIVPGIIVALVFGLYGFHIVDTGERNPIDALKASMALTAGSRLQLLGLFVLLFLINLVGLLLLVVGVLFTSGISLVALAWVYRRLSAGQAATPQVT